MGVEVRGINEILNRLQRAGESGDRTINKALKDGGQVLLNHAKIEVPVSNVRGKHIKDALKVSSIRTDISGLPHVRIGLVSPKSRKDVYYAHMVHNGHKIVTGKGATRTVHGNVPANPFMQRTYERKSEEAIRAVRETMLRGLGL